MRPRLLALLVLAPLLLSVGAAAQGEGILFRAEPGAIDLPAGAEARTALVLRNDLARPVNLSLEVVVPDMMKVDLDRTFVHVPPGEVVRVGATVRTHPDAPLGESKVVFHATLADPATMSSPRTANQQDPSTSDTARPSRWSAPLLVRVVPPPPPKVDPLQLEVALTPGEVRTFALHVGNPGRLPRSLPVTWDLPAGWRVVPETERVELPAHGALSLNVSFARADGASDGAGTLFIGEPRSQTRVELRLRALGPPLVEPAPPETSRPTTPTPDTSPLPPPSPSPFPRPGPLEVRVEPREVEIGPGGSARLTLVVQAPAGHEAAAFTFVLADGLTATPVAFDPARVRLPAGTSRFAVVVEASEDLVVGQERSGAVVPVGGTAPAPFVVRIVDPTASAPGAILTAEDAAVATTFALGAAGAGGAVLGLAWARKRWLLLVGALYTRLRPHRMLEHPLRERIVQLVRETPGITFSELERGLDAAKGVVTHHTRMLEGAGILFSSPDGQHRRFFLVEHGRQKAVPPLPDRALTRLREGGPATLSDLARELGCSRQALHHHVKRLVAEGKLVTQPGQGREVVLHAGASTPPLVR